MIDLTIIVLDRVHDVSKKFDSSEDGGDTTALILVTNKETYFSDANYNKRAALSLV